MFLLHIRQFSVGTKRNRQKMKKANDLKVLAIHVVSSQSVVDDIKKLYPMEDFTDAEFIYIGISKIKKEKTKKEDK